LDYDYDKWNIYVVIWDTNILKRNKISNTDPTEIPVVSPGVREKLRH